MRHDPARLAQLQQLAILDTSPERVFDDITRLFAKTFSVPIALVNLLDDQRDWFKSCVGLPTTESPAATSFCDVFFNCFENLIIVQDTTKDERFSGHPLVAGPPFIRFYAGARLIVGGQTVGTVCAYDMTPRDITPAQVLGLHAMAAAAIELLDARLVARR
jgi:GAF domain-containing protein